MSNSIINTRTPSDQPTNVETKVQNQSVHDVRSDAKRKDVQVKKRLRAQRAGIKGRFQPAVKRDAVGGSGSSARKEAMLRSLRRRNQAAAIARRNRKRGKTGEAGGDDDGVEGHVEGLGDEGGGEGGQGRQRQGGGDDDDDHPPPEVKAKVSSRISPVAAHREIRETADSTSKVRINEVEDKISQEYTSRMTDLLYQPNAKFLPSALGIQFDKHVASYTHGVGQAGCAQTGLAGVKHQLLAEQDRRGGPPPAGATAARPSPMALDQLAKDREPLKQSANPKTKAFAGRLDELQNARANGEMSHGEFQHSANEILDDSENAAKNGDISEEDHRQIANNLGAQFNQFSDTHADGGDMSDDGKRRRFALLLPLVLLNGQCPRLPAGLQKACNIIQMELHITGESGAKGGRVGGGGRSTPSGSGSMSGLGGGGMGGAMQPGGKAALAAMLPPSHAQESAPVSPEQARRDEATMQHFQSAFGGEQSDNAPSVYASLLAQFLSTATFAEPTAADAGAGAHPEADAAPQQGAAAAPPEPAPLHAGGKPGLPGLPPLKGGKPSVRAKINLPPNKAGKPAHEAEAPPVAAEAPSTPSPASKAVHRPPVLALPKREQANIVLPGSKPALPRLDDGRDGAQPGLVPPVA